MNAVQLVGRKTNFYGHTLWEIVANLRNFGVGRFIIRKTFQRYPEPCFYRILQVQAVNSPADEKLMNYRKVRVTVEKKWRGINFPKPLVLYSCSYKPDFELIPRVKENIYIQNTKKIMEKIIPNEIELPSLLRDYVTEEISENRPTMNVNFRKTNNKFLRVAMGNEKPTMDFVALELKKLRCSKLYKSA